MNSRRIGFTGTQRGLTSTQQGIITTLLREYTSLDWFIHGGCIGADAEAHMLARAQGMRVRVWPAEGVGHKAASFPDAEETMPPAPPLVRNTYIVKDDLELLIACPREMVEQQRSGTWTTIRRARSANVSHSIILPNGHVDTVVYVSPIRTAKGLSW